MKGRDYIKTLDNTEAFSMILTMHCSIVHWCLRFYPASLSSGFRNIYLPNIYCRYLILYILSEPKLRYKSFRGALHYRRELDCIKTRSRACPLNGVCSDTKEISKEIIIINRPLEEGEVNWAAEKSLKGSTKNLMRQTLICAEKVAGIRCIILLANKQQTFLCKQIRMQRTGGGEEIVGE